MSVPSIPPIGMGFSTSDGPYAQHYPPPPDLAKNPLADSHDFKQACSSCYIKTGKRSSINHAEALLGSSCKRHLFEATGFACSVLLITWCPQDLEYWITPTIQRTTNAKKICCWGDVSMMSSQCGSLFARDPKTSTWVLFIFAKVIVCGFFVFVTFILMHLLNA